MYRCRQLRELVLMHGIPKDTDLSPLVGTTLEQLCIGLHEIILRFGDNLSLTVEGSLRIDFDSTSWNGSKYGEAANVFAALLGVEVIRCAVIDSKTLCIEFANGGVVTAYDSKDCYESFQLRLGDRLVVV
jgi:hypothetical protein